jgi:putative nucleotidyltransferase with HDIG domain
MSNANRKTSIFSQKLDRIVFTAYFLGAVVPLLALAFIAQRFVLPALDDRLEWMGLIALVLSVASLTLGSFLVLRRTTHRTVEQMDRDNRRLDLLVKASGAFGDALHGSESAATTVRCALELSEADAVYAFVRADEASPPTLLQSLGNDAEKLLEQHSRPITELLNLVMREGRPALRGPGEAKSDAGVSAAAVPLSGENTPMGALVAIQIGARAAFDPAEVHALSTLAALASASLRNADLRDAQRNFFAHMTELVVTALDAHLDQQSGHGTRVAQYANRLGRELQLDEQQLHRLHFASLLHDIGMLRIDRALLGNDKACEKHPQIGARMLERIRLWEDVAPIVLHHHERFDGEGYPEGLVGEAIPLEARIIAVCESFDVMVSNSSCTIATDPPGALREIVEGAGSQFDPEVAEAFASLVERGVIEPATG